MALTSLRVKAEVFTVVHRPGMICHPLLAITCHLFGLFFLHAPLPPIGSPHGGLLDAHQIHPYSPFSGLCPWLPSACNSPSPKPPGCSFLSFLVQLICHLTSQALPGHLVNLESHPGTPAPSFGFNPLHSLSVIPTTTSAPRGPSPVPSTGCRFE